MSNCPKCGAEVEIGQKMCAWCGTDLPASAPAPAPTRVQSAAPRQGVEPVSASESQDIPSIDAARTLAKTGDLSGAEDIFKAILAENPQDQESLFGLGGIHFKRGSKTQAAELWRRLKILNPAYPHIDSWLNQVVEKVNPPAASPEPPVESRQEAPLPRPLPQFPQKPFQPKQRTRRPGTTPSQLDLPEGDDDWTKQSIRVVALDEPETEEPVPVPEVKQRNASSIPPPEKIAAWTKAVSWISMLIFAAAVIAAYFILPG